ncbi:MAG: DNA polymerase IV, partial [Phycisphaerales bacterium]
PVGVIPGLGPAAEEKLRRLAVRTVADLRELDEGTLESRFGVWGARLWQLARAIDDRPVTPEHEAKSIGRERTFAQDLTDREEVRAVLLQHAEHVARRLRKHDLRARAVTLKIRFGDFRTITRSATLENATSATDELWAAARDLFDAWAKSGFEPVRLIGMSAGRFGDAQSGLFDAEERERRAAVDRATDAVAGRFGAGAISRARAMRPKRPDKPA